MPKTTAHFSERRHQRFEDLKAAITGKDEKSIINEVERGEDYLKEKFETALNSDTLSGESRSVVETLLPVGALRPRPDEPAQARHGNAGLASSEKGQSLHEGLSLISFDQ